MPLQAVRLLATSREPLRVEGEQRAPPATAGDPASIGGAHRRGGARLPRRAAVRRARGGEPGRVRARRRRRPARRRYLPQAGWRSAGDRARRGAHRRVRRARPRGAPRRSSPAAHRRASPDAAAAPLAAREPRLGPRPAARARAGGSPPCCNLRRRLHARGGERGRGERRNRRGRRSSSASRIWSRSR